MAGPSETTATSQPSVPLRTTFDVGGKLQSAFNIVAA
jgi:hypothetical protein